MWVEGHLSGKKKYYNLAFATDLSIAPISGGKFRLSASATEAGGASVKWHLNDFDSEEEANTSLDKIMGSINPTN